METEYVKCGLCGNDEPKYLFSSKDKTYGVKESFDLVKCRECGLVYMNPRPKIKCIELIYPPNYYSFSEAPPNPRHSFNSFLSGKKEEVLKEWSGEKNKISIKKIILLPYYFLLKEFDHTFIPFKEKGNLLDVGCGIGTFLLGYKRQGWVVSGIEINKGAASYGRDKFGLNIFNGTLEQSGFAENYFDVITMFHFLEHASEPKSILKKSRKLLRREGLLVVVTPNFNSIESRIFGKEWRGIDIPRHFYHFSPKTLSKIIEGAGFKVEKLKYNVSPNNFLESSDYYFKIKKIPLNLNNSFFAFLLIPLYFILSRCRAGGLIAVYARKK